MFRQANLLKGVDPSAMSIGALKQHLRALGISCDGMLEKSELVARLNTACLATGSGAAQTNDSTLPPAETASGPPLPAGSGPARLGAPGQASGDPRIIWRPPAEGVSSPPKVMTEEEAHRLAEAEGISLVLAPCNASGYKGVSRNNKSEMSPKSGYCAQFCQHGRTYRLGSFSSAPEAALAYARHLKAVQAMDRRQQEEFIMRGSPFQARTGLPAPEASQPPWQHAPQFWG